MVVRVVRVRAKKDGGSAANDSAENDREEMNLVGSTHTPPPTGDGQRMFEGQHTAPPGTGGAGLRGRRGESRYRGARSGRQQGRRTRREDNRADRDGQNALPS